MAIATFDQAARLFSTHPSEIYQHPVGMAIKKEEIPLGVLKGWDVYAIKHFTNQITYSKELVIKEAGIDITIEFDKYYYYYYHPVEAYGLMGPLWYQSSTTLRFIRNKDVLSPLVKPQPMFTATIVELKKEVWVSYIWQRGQKYHINSTLAYSEMGAISWVKTLYPEVTTEDIEIRRL